MENKKNNNLLLELPNHELDEKIASHSQKFHVYVFDHAKKWWRNEGAYGPGHFNQTLYDRFLSQRVAAN